MEQDQRHVRLDMKKLEIALHFTTLEVKICKKKYSARLQAT